MITLQIQVKSEPVTRRVKLSKYVSDEFDFYVKAAVEKTPGADESLVLEGILKNHFRKDKGVKGWMHSRDALTQLGP